MKQSSKMAVYHVYILANPSGVLYTGVTNYLERRVTQHKQELTPGFTKKYAATRLVHFEPFGDVRNATRVGQNTSQTNFDDIIDRQSDRPSPTVSPHSMQR